MPITVKWLIEDRVLFTRFEGEIDSEQLANYLDESLKMRDEAIERNGEDGFLVHTITDATAVTKQTLNVGSIQKMMKSLRSQRVGWSVYISHNRVDRFLSAVGHQFAGVRNKSVESLPEALAFLAHSEPSLKDELERVPVD